MIALDTNVLVLCELVRVLTRRSGVSRADIAAALDRLLRTELIVVADAATEVVTFDKALKGESGCRILGT